MPRLTSPLCSTSSDAELLVPNAGTYVAIQLDAVHMVKPLDDPELTAAAQRLPIRKYIGYVYHVQPQTRQYPFLSDSST